jgi:hypothetical protein
MEKRPLDYSDFNVLKEKLIEIYNKSEIIHVDLSMKRKRLNNIEAKIVGIYDRFLCITSVINNYEENFTITFIDLLTYKVKIKELETGE